MKSALHPRAAFFLALVLIVPSTVSQAQVPTQHALASLARSVDSPQESAADPLWKHAVIYEVYPRRFQDSDGDGVGISIGIIGATL